MQKGNQISKEEEKSAYDLINTRRVYKLVKGKFLDRVQKGGKIQSKYFKLTDNLQQLVVGQNPKGPFQQILSINEIGSITTGVNENVIKTKKLDEDKIKLTFTLNSQQNKPIISFLARDRKQFAIWIDSFRYLKKTPVQEIETRQSFDELLKIDSQITLLEKTKIAPEIPQPPKDYNFVVEATDFK
ncbi:engulfment and cell motility protein [Anaeramoeba flamelloides]|uniref:Engulfment and cell motility protein n=1 Tax=Anaeramoeba flamelloides TaxID=1746091 RepID=A0AAV7YCR7_9EUKA|nr:engulfment and cell motility protein [Anaeramoeba flamelloides]KAJ6250390.1 engulfment and cell motility protein [Anaeramoeba flamelloides]